MKRILLTQGKFAIVDDANYKRLNKHKWYAKKGRNTWYAMRSLTKPDGKQIIIRMHRELLGLEYGDKRESDHRNHNGLDNRLINLRICTGSQNQYNQKPQKNCSSSFKGVIWRKDTHKWRSQIKINGHTIYLGCFASEVEAAKTYDRKAMELFGEYAHVNFEGE